MWCLGRKRVETRRENIKWVTPACVLRKIKFLFLLSYVIPPFLAVLCVHPPTPFQNYLPRSIPRFFFPPSLSLDLRSPLYVSVSPEQTGLLGFTIGPRLEGWQTHKGSASLLGAARKLKEGIVEAQKASALRQTCMQKISACKMRMQTHICCTYITSKDSYMYPCKLCVSVPLFRLSPLMFSHTYIQACKRNNEWMRACVVNWVSKPIYVTLHCLEFVACPHFLTRVGVLSKWLIV